MPKPQVHGLMRTLILKSISLSPKVIFKLTTNIESGKSLPCFLLWPLWLFGGVQKVPRIRLYNGSGSWYELGRQYQCWVFKCPTLLATSGAELKAGALSSGKKINSAAGDAAGFAIAEQTAQIRGLNMATRTPMMVYLCWPWWNIQWCHWHASWIRASYPSSHDTSGRWIEHSFRRKWVS